MISSSIFFIPLSISFFTSILLNLILVPKLKTFGINKMLIDYEDERKQKKENIVRIGGAACITSFTISILLFTALWFLSIKIKSVRGFFNDFFCKKNIY